MPQFLAPVQFAVVTTLPSAASAPNAVLVQDGKLWFSDGAAWVDLGAAPTSHTHTASQISDSTTTGRALITAADDAAGRTALGLGTAAVENIGTSGATVPRLSGANTWGAVQVFGGAGGSEGGEIALQAPVTGTNLTGNVAVDIQGNNFRVFGLYSGQTRGFRFNFDGGTPGGQNTLWHDGNFNPGSYGTLAGNNTWSGAQNSTSYFSFQVNNNANLPIATASGGVGGLEALGTGTGAAFMSFHRPGAYAVHFGLDSDNRLKVGGWSMGAVAHEIWHSGNQASVAAGTTTGHAALWNNVSGRYEASALTAASIGDFAAASRAQTEASILAGPNITITPAGTGATRTLTIAALGAGTLDIPLNVQNATYTFALADRGRAVIKNNTTAYTWTIPLESSVAFPDGAAITVINDSGTGAVTISPAGGVTLIAGATTGSFTLAVNESRTLHKVGTNRWRVL